ncbi:MAG: dual specificity protein phosphatase family protein [Planctomycetales bacterium]
MTTDNGQRTTDGEHRPWGLALLGAALLSLEFMLVYGACNLYTATRSDVGTWFFGWELAIPLLPWLILPYMSIDLLFFASPFLARDRAELKSLALRLGIAPLLAAVGFLALPLRLGFERQRVEGPFGPVFAFLFSFDAVYNLFPSLHVAYTLVLRRMYARHTSGVVWWIVQAWFVLITLSTVFTHQHHLVDVAGGFVAGLLIFYAVPDTLPGPETALARSPRRPRLAAAYGALAVLFALSAATLGPRGGWWLLLSWPAVALTIVASAYLGAGPAVFRKDHGRLHFSARILLAPYLFGLALSRRHYWRQAEACCAVGEDLIVGRLITNAADARSLFDARGVVAVLDLTAEHSERPEFRNLGERYANIQVLDLTRPTLEQLDAAVAFISRWTADGRVYVHCGLGYGRTAAVAAAYLLASGEAATVDEACRLVSRARPQVVLDAEGIAMLETFRDRALAAAPA